MEQLFKVAHCVGPDVVVFVPEHTFAKFLSTLHLLQCSTSALATLAIARSMTTIKAIDNALTKRTISDISPFNTAIKPFLICTIT